MDNFDDREKKPATKNASEPPTTKINEDQNVPIESIEDEKQQNDDGGKKLMAESLVGVGDVNVMISEVITGAIEHLIDEQQERKKEVDALLGGCLDLVCTYSEGYKTRQALYSCKTCFGHTGQLAGVCYGCTENCHDGHELVELYTKRNFCCDCGNSKFPAKCKLYEQKDPVNARNRYDDNFKGIFCVCKKPYPPEEGETDESQLEDMIQCTVCEDWFHPTHVLSDPLELAKLERKENEQFDLICFQCVQKLPWLFHYNRQLQKQQQQLEGESGGNECKLDKFQKVAENKDKMEETEEEEEGKKSLCLPMGWRNQLCGCNRCKALYEDSDCLFLLDNEDTIDFYEQKNQEQAAEQRAKMNKNANENDAVLQREIAIHMKSGIDQMKNHCVEFFAKRTAEKRGAAMTEEDVEECFQELREKRQRLMEYTANGEEKEAAWTQ